MSAWQDVFARAADIFGEGAEHGEFLWSSPSTDTRAYAKQDGPDFVLTLVGDAGVVRRWVLEGVDGASLR